MKTLEESVVTAMDGTDKELFPYLPYILQDAWEIGANPGAIIRLIRRHADRFSEKQVLDLGCGKGAVSVKVAKELGCRCHGIDAIPEFIAFARQKADEFGVGHLCIFETGDIREKIKALSGYDMIILGAIGPVFGDYYATLTTLSGCLKKDGIFIIDDGYIDNNSDYHHPLILKQDILLQQIDSAGMKLIEDDIFRRDDIRDSDDRIFESLKKRCTELMDQHPDKRELFMHYIQRQVEENDVLENKVVCSTLVIARK